MLILSKWLYLSCASGCQFGIDHTKVYFVAATAPYALRVIFPNVENKRLANWQAVALVGCGDMQPDPEATPEVR